MPLPQRRLINAVAERAELSKIDAQHAVAEFEKVVLGEPVEAQWVRIGRLVPLTARLKPAQKARNARDPIRGA